MSDANTRDHDPIADGGGDRHTPAHHPHGQAGQSQRGLGGVGRRRFVSALGAGGLGVAAALFGRATPAEAVQVACCKPQNYPNITINSCTSVRSPYRFYVWMCRPNSVTRCECCEVIDPVRGITNSAVQCRGV